jgi:hypothetical protein
MTVTDKDIDQFEKVYWSDMCKDGELIVSVDWLRQEMLDYYMLMKNSSQVYGAITDGKIRDTRSDADVVLNCASTSMALRMEELLDSLSKIDDSKNLEKNGIE